MKTAISSPNFNFEIILTPENKELEEPRIKNYNIIIKYKNTDVFHKCLTSAWTTHCMTKNSNTFAKSKYFDKI